MREEGRGHSRERERRSGASESILRELAGLLGFRQRGRETHLETVRMAMLDALGGRGPEALARRLRHALDIESLWYLRTEVHLALCRLETECDARERLEAITALFIGAVPAALSRRIGMGGPTARLAAPPSRHHSPTAGH